LRIPYPSGLVFPDIVNLAKGKEFATFNRLTVAYGLSYAIESLDEQRFPSNVPRAESLSHSEVVKIYGEDTVDT
jgi:hypothetical protein